MHSHKGESRSNKNKSKGKRGKDIIPVTKASRKAKAKWSENEDMLLEESVKVHGARNWIAVSSLVPGRNAKQCRERWTSQLDPSINHMEFSMEEDETIQQQYKIHGRQWAKIAVSLTGRSPIAIKNRFNLLTRHKEHKQKYGGGKMEQSSNEDGSNMSDDIVEKPKIISQESSLTEESDNLHDIISMIFKKELFDFPFGSVCQNDENEVWF